ncbi:putative ATP-grasp-modified RiPP [Streptomonospora sp. S1-112]|uniref:ATP-grasp-modified RiPP n=1 Tax=Streptomonospora mangrovi TaxID=2883123 RepID=A0A9X3NNG0_9ACTN|nr:putative ATP-grasp-modified RiPP [Streptomonospora mangrovi]MDA0565261.1 putative ATP-grasp-modified RiPP [Streptomonospora mangrovi]
MFQNADRLPTGTPRPDAPTAVAPWSLRRMALYRHTTDVGFVATRIDPATQLGAGDDGELIVAKHKKSNTGTEDKTRTNRGDGDGRSSVDEDHTQDSDQD